MTATRQPSSDAQIPLPFALGGICWVVSIASHTGWDLTWLFVGFVLGLLIVFLIGYVGTSPIAPDPVSSPTVPVAIGFDRDAFFKPPRYNVPFDGSDGQAAEQSRTAVAGQVSVAIDDSSFRLLDMQRKAQASRQRLGWVASTPGQGADSADSARLKT